MADGTNSSRSSRLSASATASSNEFNSVADRFSSQINGASSRQGQAGEENRQSRYIPILDGPFNPSGSGVQLLYDSRAASITPGAKEFFKQVEDYRFDSLKGRGGVMMTREMAEDFFNRGIITGSDYRRINRNISDINVLLYELPDGAKKLIGRAGVIGSVVGGGLAVYEVLNAGPGERGQAIVRVAGGVAGGIVGSSAGLALGGALGGLAAPGLVLLGVSAGPVGWFIVGSGIAFAVAGGAYGDEAGRRISDGFYEFFEKGLAEGPRTPSGEPRDVTPVDHSEETPNEWRRSSNPLNDPFKDIFDPMYFADPKAPSSPEPSDPAPVPGLPDALPQPPAPEPQAGPSAPPVPDPVAPAAPPVPQPDPEPEPVRAAPPRPRPDPEPAPEPYGPPPPPEDDDGDPDEPGGVDPGLVATPVPDEIATPTGGSLPPVYNRGGGVSPANTTPVDGFIDIAMGEDFPMVFNRGGGVSPANTTPVPDAIASTNTGNLDPRFWSNPSAPNPTNTTPVDDIVGGTIGSGGTTGKLPTGRDPRIMADLDRLAEGLDSFG